MYGFSVEFIGRDTAKGREMISLWQYEGFRHIFRIITAVWGVGFLLEAALRVAIVYNTSPSTALSLSKVTPYIWVGVFVAWTVGYGRYQGKKGQQRWPPPPPLPPPLPPGKPERTALILSQSASRRVYTECSTYAIFRCMDEVLDIRDLRMRYGKTDVLNGVSFAARRGEVLALLGPNGAGKTTTIEILEGFRMRSAGQVSVLGADPAHGGEAWRARTGVVLQSWRDHAKWQVRELLAHLGRYYAPYSTPGVTRPWDVDDLLETVGLTPHAGKRVRNLSGGQRRRLDVAIGIVGRPELLFLDEPTAGFDPEARRDFQDVVHRLADLEETTILLTTHDLDEAERLADRILILTGGTIIADGSADELARTMSGQSEVRWSRDGQRFVHAADDATAFVRELFRQYGESVEDLEVRRASLEDTYMALVRQAEHGAPRRLTAVAA